MKETTFDRIAAIFISIPLLIIFLYVHAKGWLDLGSLFVVLICLVMSYLWEIEQRIKRIEEK